MPAVSTSLPNIGSLSCLAVTLGLAALACSDSSEDGHESLEPDVTQPDAGGSDVPLAPDRPLTDMASAHDALRPDSLASDAVVPDVAQDARPGPDAQDARPLPDTQDARPLPDASHDGQPDSAPPDAAEPPPPPPGPTPVVLVHGVNGSSANYDVMVARLVEDGWPPEMLFAIDFEDPEWGCNADNGAALALFVEGVLETTGHQRVDLVAHSMGSLSSRHYVKNLGGDGLVDTYVTLGGQHHGLIPPCLAPAPPCVWEELCTWGAFVTQLNEEPATPGELHWVSIFGTADRVVPNWSSNLEGAENIELEGVEHSGPNGLLEDIGAYEHVRRVLRYEPW